MINGLGAGDTATFGVTFTGDGRPSRFDLQFIREGTDVVLGSIPVVLGTPVVGEDYEYEDCEDGEHSEGIDFGNQRLDGFVPNVAPSFVTGVDPSVAEDSGAQTVVAWATNISPGSPSESSQLVDFIVSNDNHGLFAVQPSISANGTLTYTPAANAFGSALVTVQIHDNGGTALGGFDISAPQTFTINVAGVNDATNAEGDSYSVNEDGVLTIATTADGVLSNDTDIDSAATALMALVSVNPSHGSVVLNQDGTFTYTPDADFNGNDTFTYYVNDGAGNSNAATVEITINPTNDDPLCLPTIGITEPGSVSFPVGTPVTNIFGTGSMSSVVERDGYSFTMTGLNTYGLVSINTANVDGAHAGGGGLLIRQAEYAKYPVVVRRLDGQPFGIRTAAIREDSTASGLQIPIAGVSHETGIGFSHDFIFDRDPTTFDMFDLAAADERFLSVDSLLIYPVDSTVIEPIIATHIIDRLDLFTLSAPSIVQSGKLLTANTGDIGDVDGLGPFAYQWLRDGVAIVDATNDTYLVGNADSGSLISVQLTYTDGGGTVESLTSTSVGPVDKSNSAPTGNAVIVGSAREDQQLSVDVSSIADADGLGEFSYVWSNGATSPMITLSDSDVNQIVAVTVSYTDGAGKIEYVTSAQIGPVSNVNDAPTGKVVITGLATEDQILTAVTIGIADADGLGEFSYLWSTGATTSSITLGDADVGSNLSVTVNYTDGNGTSESLIGEAVGPVANVNDAPSGIPTITGSTQNGQILSASTNTVDDADGVGAFSYQWLRDGVVIAGATASTYHLTAADVGNQLTIQVTYTDARGTEEGPLTSAPTSTVTDVVTGGGTKFFVVDHSQRLTFEYDANGVALDENRLNKEDKKPRGIAASPDGSTLWVVDEQGEIFIYDNDGQKLGSWEFKNVDKAEGVTVHGDDLWIVDRGEDRVYFFQDGALRRSGSAKPTASFRLASSNKNPMDLVTDGTHIWVVNSTASFDKVYRYSTNGQLEGSWAIDPANTSPTGITIDPNDVNHIWIVDNATDSVFRYDNGTARVTGSQAANGSFALDPANSDPQGIADPRPALSLSHLSSYADLQSPMKSTDKLAIPQVAIATSTPSNLHGLRSNTPDTTHGMPQVNLEASDSERPTVPVASSANVDRSWGYTHWLTEHDQAISELSFEDELFLTMASDLENIFNRGH